MKCDKHTVLLYAVTDRAWVGKQTLYQQIEAALQNGVTCVQLREKTLDEEAFAREAAEIGELCRRYGVPLIINDNVELALRCGADGVHVGQEDMEAAAVRKRVGDGMIVGVSAHNVAEAMRAEACGADYLGVGAVFGSATKTNVCDMTVETLRAIRDAVKIPVVAIGGINEKNIGRLHGSGVDGVAVVSAIFAAEDPGAAAARLRKLSEEMVKSGGKGSE